MPCTLAREVAALMAAAVAIGSVLGAVALLVLFLLPVLTAGYLAFRLRWGRRLQAAAA